MIFFKVKIFPKALFREVQSDKSKPLPNQNISFSNCFVLAGFLLIPLKGAFMANPGLNSFILASFLIGVIFISSKVALLGPEVKWISNYRRYGNSTEKPKTTQFIGSTVTMLGSRRDGNISLSTNSLSLLDSIDARLSESAIFPDISLATDISWFVGTFGGY